MSLFWLSFVDDGRFLGACVVHGGDTGDMKADLRVAIDNAWRLGCNPGGGIRFQRAPADVEHRVAQQWIGRLLTREEVALFEGEMSDLASCLPPPERPS